MLAEVGTAQRSEFGLLTVLMKHNPDWAEAWRQHYKNRPTVVGTN
jgi:hypothetical protein